MTPAEKRDAVMFVTKQDWEDFCVVMRKLTWGTEVMDRWHRLRERIDNQLCDLHARKPDGGGGNE